MLCYNRNNVFTSIDTNKTNGSQNCIIYHFCYFLDKKFKFQLPLCNDCHDA